MDNKSNLDEFREVAKQVWKEQQAQQTEKEQELHNQPAKPLESLTVASTICAVLAIVLGYEFGGIPLIGAILGAFSANRFNDAKHSAKWLTHAALIINIMYFAGYLHQRQQTHDTKPVYSSSYPRMMK